MDDSSLRGEGARLAAGAQTRVSNSCCFILDPRSIHLLSIRACMHAHIRACMHAFMHTYVHLQIDRWIDLLHLCVGYFGYLVAIRKLTTQEPTC